MDDINIKETNKFDEISSYLNSSLNTVNNCETRLNNIGSGLSGELATCYNSNATPVKTKIASIKSAIEKAKSHIISSVSIYMMADKNLIDKLNDIYDRIFEDRELTGDEMKALVMGLCSSSGAGSKELKDLINSTNLLNDADKKYILEQLDMGNYRSAIGRILVVQAEQDLKYLEENNNNEINKLQDRLMELNNERENIYTIYGYDNVGSHLDDINNKINELNKKIKDLKNEITNQRLTVNQYKNSEKEWEYDYLLNKVGSKDFENIVANNSDKEFYRDALKYYYGENKIFSPNEDEIFDYENFYTVTLQWLNSNNNGLSDVTKNKYLKKLNSMSPTGSLQVEDNYSFYLAAKDLADDKTYTNSKFNYLYNKNALNMIDGMESLKNATKYFDEDHLKILDYFYSQNDYKGANEYVNTFSDYFNKCRGMDKADEIVRNIINSENISAGLADVTSYFNGVGVGLQGWFDNVGNILSTTGNMTETEYAQMYVNNMLGSIGCLKDIDKFHSNGQISDAEYNSLLKLKSLPNINKFIENANNESVFGKTHREWIQTFFGAGVSTGNMIPSIVVSYLTSGLLSGLSPAALTVEESAKNAIKIAKYSRATGLATMALGCTSASKNEALRNGRSAVESWTYGILDGMAEASTEYLFGGIQGLSRAENFLKLTACASKFEILGKSLLNTLALSPAEEITEEMVQAYILDPVVNQIAFNEQSDPKTVNQAVDIALQTYFSTLGLGGITIVPSVSNAIKTNNEVFGKYTVDGKDVDITYGMLLDSIDKETGKISIEKLQSDINKSDESIKIKDVVEGISSIFKKAAPMAVAGMANGISNSTISAVNGLDTSGELYNGTTMPLSSEPARRAAQLKLLNGEKLSVMESLKFRDTIDKVINGYEFKPDHAYRAMSAREYLLHEKSGWIEGPPGDKEYEETVVDGVTYSNNAGIDWYLGGACRRYGKVIIEVPALKKYFTPASDGGNALPRDPTVKHIKSSPHLNPIPFKLAKVVVGQDIILNEKVQRAIDLSNVPANPDLVELVNTGEFQNASVEEQKEMISKISDYDALDTKTKLQIFKELLEKSAAKQGMTLRELGNQEGDGIVDPIEKVTADTLAKDIRTKAESVEPAITKLMESLEDENAILIGLEHRLKGKNSLSRKIIFDHNYAGISLDDAASRINDSVRYTMIIDEDNYTKKAMDTLKTLHDAGYTITRASNTWDNSLYKGLNTSIVSPDGVTFELQFHTTDSFIIKECESHVFYEIRRNEYVDKADKDIGKEIQRLHTSTIPIPANALGYDFLGGLNE